MFLEIHAWSIKSKYFDHFHFSDTLVPTIAHIVALLVDLHEVFDVKERLYSVAVLIEMD